MNRFLAAFAAITFATSASAQNSDREIAKLIAQFSDDEKAMAAVDKVVALGPAAVDQLAGQALEKQDTVARGWAIASLGYIGSDKAKATLDKIYADGGNSQLVKMWAAAARIESCKNFKELTDYTSKIGVQQALQRPVSKKVEALSSSATSADLLRMAARMPQLAPSLTQGILQASSRDLVTAMITEPDNNVRRQAAAYLGAKAKRTSTEEVASEVIRALRFKKGAKKVPWEGGALFIPSLQYEKNQARAWVGELIKWHVWCDMLGMKNQQKQIHNNIRGVGIARMAQYQVPGWNEIGTKKYLEIWRKAAGAAAVEKILAEVGATGRY